MRRVCVRVCMCLRRVIPVARTIGHLCGRTENDRNSSHYSRSKRSLSHRPRPSWLPVAARLSAPLSDRARNGTGWIGDRGFFTRAFRRIRWFLLTGTRDPRAITKDQMYSGRRGWLYDKGLEMKLIRNFIIILAGYNQEKYFRDV